MGRRASTDQAARGYPGKRKAKADAAAAQAARIAKLLAPGVGFADAPAMLHEARYAPALAVWTQLAPELRRTHRLPGEAEQMFMMFCVYMQEWTAFTDDLHTNGFEQNVGTVAGGVMERRRPAQFEREIAARRVDQYSQKFGLTPGDMYTLFKGQAAVASSNPGLFDDERAQEPAEPAQVEDGPDASLVGSMSRMRSAPPSDPVN